VKYSVVTCTKIKVLARLTTTAAMKAKRSDKEVKKVEDVEAVFNQDYGGSGFLVAPRTKMCLQSYMSSCI